MSGVDVTKVAMRITYSKDTVYMRKLNQINKIITIHN